MQPPLRVSAAADRCLGCWQAFKNYDEAGALRRMQCLKYLVLATMLLESDVDPFDAHFLIL